MYIYKQQGYYFLFFNFTDKNFVSRQIYIHRIMQASTFVGISLNNMTENAFFSPTLPARHIKLKFLYIELRIKPKDAKNVKL